MPQPDPNSLTAHIDGGARGNPGPAGFGVYVQDGEGSEVASLYGYLGHQTNNVAEYAALIAAARFAADRGGATLRVFSDSELLVRQVNGSYKVRNPYLQKLHARALHFLRKLSSVSVSHVRREQNKDADRLANVAMDTAGEQPEGVTQGLLP